MLGDLKDARWIMAKGLLFFVAGAMASGLLLLELPTLRAGVLLGLAVWCFCRFYYFAFYVIEHYIDDTYKYVGLWSAVVYVLSRTQNTIAKDESSP